MNILKRYESDDFDESYDDYAYLEDGEVGEEEGSSKPFLVKAIAMILAVTGIAYGANIALTSGSGNRAEFGQGYVVTAACDTDGITVIPYAGFVNDTGKGKFTLDSIILEGISKNCATSDFIIQVYGDTGTALTISETGTAGANYTTFDIARFYYSDSSTVSVMDTSADANVYGAFIDADILTDTTNGEFDTQGSIQITFDPDRTVSFADATLVRKITLQTVKHNS